MKRALVGVVALAVFVPAIAYGHGGHKGGGGAPYPPMYGAGCAPGVQFQYVTEYRTVRRTICETVPVTTTVDVPQTTLVPKTEDREVTQHYCEQVVETVPTKVTVYRCVTETQKRTVCRLQPETRNVEQTYTVCVPRTRVVKSTVKVCVPQTSVVPRTVTFTVYDCVPDVQKRQVVCYTPVATAPELSAGCWDPCAPRRHGPFHGDGGCGYTLVPTVREVSVTVMKPVPRQVTRTYNETVTTWKMEERPVEYTVCYLEPVTQKRTVPVTTFKPVTETIDVQVQVLRPFVEEVKVQRCRLVPRTRTVTVQVTTYTPKTETVKRPVTTWTTRTRVVEEKVPVTVCVPVSVAPPPPAAPCPPVPCW